METPQKCSPIDSGHGNPPGINSESDVRDIIETAFSQRDLDLWGVCPFDPETLTVPTRARSRVPDQAQSVIVVAFPYYVGPFKYRNVARYAMLPDYHEAAGALLEEVCQVMRRSYPSKQFEPFVDISPFNEIELAVRAGLGFRGLHTQLISERYGSYLFLGEIVSTLLIPADQPNNGHCFNCGACIRVCPGKAISSNGKLDIDRCLSNLTQKKNLTQPEEDAVRQGGMVWGCDRCGDICPHNQHVNYTPIRAFYKNICAVITSDHIKDTGRAWSWRGPKPLQRNLRLIEDGRNGRN